MKCVFVLIHLSIFRRTDDPDLGERESNIPSGYQQANRAIGHLGEGLMP